MAINSNILTWEVYTFASVYIWPVDSFVHLALARNKQSFSCISQPSFEYLLSSQFQRALQQPGVCMSQTRSRPFSASFPGSCWPEGHNAEKAALKRLNRWRRWKSPGARWRISERRERRATCKCTKAGGPRSVRENGDVIAALLRTRKYGRGDSVSPTVKFNTSKESLVLWPGFMPVRNGDSANTNTTLWLKAAFLRVCVPGWISVHVFV